MKILIVDNDSLVGESFSEWISALFGLGCDYISSPSEAHKALSAEDYFLVVSDYHMPGKDGLEFQEEVARNFPNISFVLASGDVTDQLKEECQEKGILLLTKPIRREEVAAVILLAKMPLSFPANY